MPELYDTINDNDYGVDVYEDNIMDSFMVDDDDMYDDDDGMVFEEANAEDSLSDILKMMVGENDGDEGNHDDDSHMAFEISEGDDDNSEFVISLVPGSKQEYKRFDEEKEEEKPKNWESDKDPSKFIMYLTDKLTKIPQHSGTKIPGCERAVAYVKDLENQSSKAMRADFNGDIDEEELDKLRKDMQDMVDRLENHIERLQKSAGQQRVKFISEGFCKTCDSQAPMWTNASTDKPECVNCDSQDSDGDIQKVAGTPAVNVYMTPFERAIVSTLINSTVSAGRNMEETYGKLKNKYNFTPREELSFQQLVADHGYPVLKDRGLINEPSDPSSGDGIDHMTNYHA